MLHHYRVVKYYLFMQYGAMFGKSSLKSGKSRGKMIKSVEKYHKKLVFVDFAGK